MGKKICAWCNKYMGSFEGEGITHGICDECLKKELAEIESMHESEKAHEIVKEQNGRRWRIAL